MSIIPGAAARSGEAVPSAPSVAVPVVVVPRVPRVALAVSTAAITMVPRRGSGFLR